jgi:N-methylhydantoinase A
MGERCRLAVDIGGTFTDLVAVMGEGRSARLARAKADTTPGSLEGGVMAALKLAGLPAPSVSVFVHGTTVVINAITERRGARTALVTTKGFRDLLEIGRANRPDLYNLAYRKPRPLVPRRLCYEVAERVSYRGRVLEPLEDGDVDQLVEPIRGAGVEVVAVCFLHAWVNPEHEARAAALLRERLEVPVVASHEVSGQWREYERASTTVLSAYAQPVVSSYLGSLAGRLGAEGVTAPSYAMSSNGGVCSFDRARSNPIRLLESGPVAGVVAAAELGRRMGAGDILSLDIGGTTAKTSAVLGGRVRVERHYRVEASPLSAGYPVQAPIVDIVEIGAGGGSVAWVDPAAGLHVGPSSSGADPGPACYGRGGDAPTLTDANLLAGRLDPSYFLGGAMTLDLEAAEEALARLGQQLGVGAREAARGVLRVAVAQMTRALRLVTLRRGHDPRRFTMVAHGGAGPLHAALLARELGIGRVVVPPGPGHFSAFGMLAGGLRADAVRTRVGRLEPSLLQDLLASLEAEALEELATEGVGASVERHVELRYVGQEHTLEIPVPLGVQGDALVRCLRESFDRTSLEAYALELSGAPLEMVGARVSATAPADPVPWGGSRQGSQEGVGGPAQDRRVVDLDQQGGVVGLAVVARCQLEPGRELIGPCVVEEPAATTLVLPGQRARADRDGNLILEEA